MSLKELLAAIEGKKESLAGMSESMRNAESLLASLAGRRSGHGQKVSARQKPRTSKGKPNRTTANRDINRELARLRREMEAQDKALERVCAARDGYENGDLDAALKTYEEEVRENPTETNWSWSHYAFLSKLYCENGQIDKAWDYLNELTTTHPEHICAVRKEQTRILKKEKRWREALRTFCMHGYHMAAERPAYDVGRFVKEGKPIANKLGLAQGQMLQIGSEVTKAGRSRLSVESRTVRMVDHMVDEWLAEKNDKQA